MPQKLYMKWEGLDAVEMKLRNLEKGTSRFALEALEEVAEETLVPAIKKRIIDENIIYKGRILKAIGVRSRGGRYPMVEMGALDIPYAADVEGGQPPGAPQSWQKWVAYAKVKLGLSGRLAERVGTLMRNAAVQYGTKAHPFITPVMDERAVIFRDRFFARYRAKMRIGEK